MTRDDDTQPREGLREWLGRMTGAVAAAPVGAISALRRSRMFHPRGIALTAHLDPILDSPHAELARGLSGHALVRLSGALFKRPIERFEVLGLALRISDAPILDAQPSEHDQDLTFATILSPVTMPIAPFSTRSDDFLANRYYAVAPFHLAGIGRMKLRLVPKEDTVRIPRREPRADRLEADVRTGHAAFVLEVRRTLTRTWIPIATLTLSSFADVDQEALRFDPFRNGRGITPVGFVHAMRRATYAASQAARPRTAEGAAEGDPQPELARTTGQQTRSSEPTWSAASRARVSVH